ncbi:MAG: Protein-export membrane protein SecF [Eubacteriales bacterium]|jgi:preprotein translocase subunit SecF
MKTFNIHFFENRKIYFGISIAVMLIGLIFNILFGTQLDIQFKGGAEIKYSFDGKVVQEEVEKIVQDTTKMDVSIRILEDVKSADGNSVKNNVSISFAGSESISVDTQQAIEKALSAKYPNAHFEVVSSSSVNPTMGRNFFIKCLTAVFITCVLLVLYIAFRFRKIGGMSAGVMAVLALLHDVIMVYFTFIIFRIPLNDNFIAVVLTILGYSLNDTIIIYDRIRENRRLMGPKTPYSSLVNTSINQTFTRSLFTAGCTFSSIATVFVVGQLYGITSVTTFALPMMIGVVTGCYSSVCIAGPLYVMWQNHKAKQKETAKA